MRDFKLESKRFLHGNTTQKTDVRKVSTQAAGVFHQPVSCFQYKKTSLVGGSQVVTRLCWRHTELSTQ